MSEFDLVLYGATGFTGQLAAKYVASRYPDLRWAIAGRSQAKLVEQAQALSAKPAVIVADGSDLEALTQMVRRTKVVVTFAGPFSRYGSKLVEACAAVGTDYCDITGEIGWVREMIEKHDARAKQTGARIVHLCGHDSIPWDLSTLMLAKKLREKGGQITHVDMYDDIKSGPSGGTLETAFGILFGKDKAKANSELPFDPLLKDGEGASACTTQARNVGSFELGKKGMPHRGLFVMAGVNANAVKRSNALNKYTEKLVYSEGEAFSSVFPLALRLFGYVWFGLAVAIGPVRNMMLSSGMLPKPGEGPSQEAMLAGHLTVTGFACGSNGLKAKSVLTFPVDPGYMDTARMAVESGLALSLEGAKIPAMGGVFTPAACQGEVLLERLLNTGSTFSCE